MHQGENKELVGRSRSLKRMENTDDHRLQSAHRCHKYPKRKTASCRPEDNRNFSTYVNGQDGSVEEDGYLTMQRPTDCKTASNKVLGAAGAPSASAASSVAADSGATALIAAAATATLAAADSDASVDSAV